MSNVKENYIKDLIISKLPIFLKPGITTEAFIKKKKKKGISYLGKLATKQVQQVL